MSNTAAASRLAEREPQAPHEGLRVERGGNRRPRPLRLRVHSALRWLHIYTSMVSLLVVLFFAATGVTLNHPDWLAAERTEELKGTLPAGWKSDKGIDWLLVAEHLRATHGVHGTVAERREDDREGALTFRAPGYSADCFIDVSDGSYALTVSYQGAVGVLNDLHRGRDAGRSWAWLIDASGIFLVALSITGLGLLFYLKKVRMKGLLTFAAGALLVILLGSAAAAQPASTSSALTARAVSAANAFLATLDAAQKGKATFAYDDEQQRKRWSNLPVRMTPRGGISIGEMSAPQRTAAMALLAAVLSPRGYEKVQQIVEADETLKRNENGNPMFGRDLYYFSILGTPSATTPWMLQFGGHHLAVNVTIAGAQGILTPTLTGAQPALYTVNGKTVRPLGQESDKALALLNALDESQRAKAVLSFRVADLVLGPGQDDKRIQPEGLKGTEMTEQQRAMLLDVIGEWANIVHESAAAARLAEIRAGLADTYFAWSGPTTAEAGRNIAAYYRIQGPNLVIEYAPQRLGGDPTMHVHTMYRDPTNDYGRRVTGK